MSRDPLLPGPQRPDRPSRGARGRPAAGPPPAPAARRPPAAALGPPPRLRGLSHGHVPWPTSPVPTSRPARGGLPVAAGDPEHRRGRDGRRSPSSPPTTSRPPSARSRRSAPNPSPSPTPDAVDGRRPSPSRPSPRSTARQGLRRGLQQLRRHRPGRQRRRDRATEAGWQVVGSDNWYGTIPASTVYYPPRARGRRPSCSALDLGITGVMPAVDPMRLDRLTVILTADHALTSGRPRRRRSGSAVTGWARGVHLRRRRAAVRRAGRARPTSVVGLDFDGTLVADRRRPRVGPHPPRRARRC